MGRQTTEKPFMSGRFYEWFAKQLIFIDKFITTPIRYLSGCLYSCESRGHIKNIFNILLHDVYISVHMNSRSNADHACLYILHHREAYKQADFNLPMVKFQSSFLKRQHCDFPQPVVSLFLRGGWLVSEWNLGRLDLYVPNTRPKQHQLFRLTVTKVGKKHAFTNTCICQ